MLIPAPDFNIGVYVGVRTLTVDVDLISGFVNLSKKFARDENITEGQRIFLVCEV